MKKEKMILRKPNELLHMQCCLSLEAKKIMSYILYYFQNVSKNREYCIPTAELLPNLNLSGGKAYKVLLDAGYALTHTQLVDIDVEKKRFKIKNIFQEVTYENGMMKVLLTDPAVELFSQVNKKYTTLDLEELFAFSSAYALRLYEILKSECYDMADRSKTEYEITYSMNALRFQIGTAMIDIANNKAATAARLSSYDEAIMYADRNVYKEWRDFKKRVLDVSCKEINEKTTMTITYDTVKSGLGGGVSAIKFKVTILEKVVAAKGSLIPFISRLSGIVDDYLDVERIAVAAQYDLDKVDHALKIYKKQEEKVRDKTAWLVAAVKNGKYKDVSVDPRSVATEDMQRSAEEGNLYAAWLKSTMIAAEAGV